MNLQNAVLEKIRSGLGNPKDWVDRITEALPYSKSSVYKRIKGDTMLSLEDLTNLMRSFNFSFDDIVFQDRKKIGFQFPYKNKEIKSFFDYVDPLKEFVLSANQIPELKVQYATNEFPFFFYFHDQYLTYFKFYMFAKTVWNIDSYKSRKFSLDDFGEWFVIKDDINLILKSYYQISNVEIWNGSVLVNTLNQIKYFLQSGLFKYPEEALVLCDRLEQVINHVRSMAEFGKKFLIGQDPELSHARFEMYHNEITHTNNILLLESPGFSQIYFAFDNPNYIITDEEKLVQYTIDWFETIKKNALPISQSAERNRRSFFSQISKQIDFTREQIADIIKYQS